MANPQHIEYGRSARDEVTGSRIGVLGAARSGLSAAALLAEHGAEVFLSDHEVMSDQARNGIGELRIEFEEGGHTDRVLDSDWVVASPGIPNSAPIMQRIREADLPLYSEIEIASWFCSAPIVAVTGSNGKTTTTSLIGHIFSGNGRKPFIAGNIGIPFSDIAAQTTDDDVVVLEVSSFQLDHIDRFRPTVSVLLNITPDHMDRYNNDLDAYAESKFRITANQVAGDAFIYNLDDSEISSRLSRLDDKKGPRQLGFTIRESCTAAGSIHDDSLIIQLGAKKEVLMQSDELALRGRHNAGNSLAAAIAARVMEVRSEVVRSSLSSFEGVPHRLEFVRETGGIRYVNDSKATNVNAVWFALESMNQPVIWIAGGRDKGNDYSALTDLVQEKVRILIALGEGAEKLLADLGPHVDQAVSAESMADAVSYGSLLGREGETVLLSPACSSFDMFDNFEERGDIFKQIVSDL